MFYYVYKLTCRVSNEYYFGSRGCKVDPTIDNYLGSMKSWRPIKENLHKEILKSDFKSREEAMFFERNLIIKHKSFELCKNAHIPGVGFHAQGLGQFVDKNGKVYRLDKNDPLVTNGSFSPFWKGRKHSKESKIKMSNSAKDRVISSEMEKQRRSRISKSNMKSKSKEHIENIRKSKLGKNNPMFGKTGNNNKLSKPVIQYTLDEVKVKEWDNARIAAKELGLSYSAINANCNGRTKSSGGYLWKFKE